MMRYLIVVLLGLLAVTGMCQDPSATPADLLKKAEAEYQSKHYEESIALYKRALPLLEEADRSDVEYNLACSLALAEDRDEAFATLKQAIEGGYTNRKGTEADKDLISLHTDPRWQSLLEAMTEFKAQQDKRWGDAAFVTPNAPNLSDEEKLAGLSELWAQARYGFANFWHVRQLDWNQTYRDFIPKVLATKSTEEYYRVLERFYALLQDGHSNVYSPGMVNGTIGRLDLRTNLVEGHVLVIGSRNPAADLQGLRPGDEIVTINGEPATSWAKHNVEPYVSASSPQDSDTRTFEYQLFLGSVGTSFTLGTETPSGQPSTHTFVIGKRDPKPEPSFEFRMLQDGVAYIKLNEFDDNTDATEWDKHWPEIQQARALVIDLRDNGGGSDSIGNHILSDLIAKDSPGELSRSTRWIASYRAWGMVQTPLRFPVNIIHPNPSHHFSGPVVLLTSPQTYSAAEDMVVVFSQAHRGLIVGEPTGGSSGQPLMFKLPGGGVARICTKHDSFADEREFVGVGVTPDIPVHLTRNDIVTGHDSVLAAALDWLKAKSQESLVNPSYKPKSIATHSKQ